MAEKNNGGRAYIAISVENLRRRQLEKLTGGQDKSLDEAERLIVILRSNTACLLVC